MFGKTDCCHSCVFNNKAGLTIAVRFKKNEDVIQDSVLERVHNEIKIVFLDPLDDCEIVSKSELIDSCKNSRDVN